MRTISRRNLLQILSGALPSLAQGRKPNFLFLFTDDQRFNTLHALGNKEVQTPNMDNLVRHGLHFSHAAIMGGTVGAICQPSRAMLMTGRTLFQVHDHTMAANPPAGESRKYYPTFPELLRRNGYETFGTGKWHNGTSMFARSFSAGENIFFGGMSDHLQVPVHDFDPAGRYPRAAQRVAKTFSSQLFSDSAIRYLKQRNRDKPFLAYVAYTSPHDPRMAPARFARMYSTRDIQVPENFLPRHPFDNGDLKLRDEVLAPFPRTPEVIKEHIAGYYAMITEVDYQIGRVLAALVQSGEADNTYVIFTADNGLAVGQHGLLGKQNLYDHSMRVPLVIAGPGVKKGQHTDGLCYLMDVCPTVLELAGVEPPEGIAGRSLRPMMKDPEASIREEVVMAYRHYQRGIRTRKWKLILYNVGGEKHTQLFDMECDPLERQDLSGEAAHAARITELRALLAQRLKEYGDRTDLDAAVWPAFRD